MRLAAIRQWGIRFTSYVIAADLAFFSRDVPWRPKLAVIGIIIGAPIVGRMLGETVTDALGPILNFACLGGAIATMHKLTPPKLMSGFRARASGPVIQSYVSAYFECIAVVAVIFMLFATWWWAVTE